MMSCTQCLTDAYIIEDTRHGDLVCTRCGLVAQGCLLDDRAPYEEVTAVPRSHAAYEGATKLRRLQARIDKDPGAGAIGAFRIALRDRLGLDEDEGNVVAGLAISLYRMAVDAGVIITAAKLSLAATFYASKMHRRGLMIEDIRDAFSCSNNVKPWDDKLMDCWRKSGLGPDLFMAASTDDVLTRMVYSISQEVLPADKAWPVLSAAQRMAGLVADRIPSVKPSKLNATLIHIACKAVLNDDLRPALAKGFGVSVSTMKKHEALIQDALCGM